MALTRAQKKAAETVKKIARRDLGIETLDARGSDSLDFHDLHVDVLKEALLAAHEAGRRSVTDTDGGSSR